jgi:hypothetical protein
MKRILLFFLLLSYMVSVGQQFTLTFDTQISPNQSDNINYSSTSDSRFAVEAVSSSSYTVANRIPNGGLASGGNNLRVRDCGPAGQTLTTVFSGINMTGKTGVVLGLAGRRSSTSFSGNVSLDFSIDGGVNWTNLSTNIFSSSNGSWLYSVFDVSAADNQSNVSFRTQFTTTLASTCSGSSPNFRIDDFIVDYNGSPLPLNLISFSVNKKGALPHLSWSTTSETNFSHFMVQKSKDAKGFESIGRVESVGFESDKSAYSFVDEKPFAGNNYYRLKMVDKDGTEDYSKIISVKFDGTAKAVFYPNPTQDIVNFENIKSEDIRSVTVHKINGEFLGEVLPTDSGLDISAFKSRELILQLNLKNNQILTSRIIKNL